ncbi:disease resistance RGA3 [Olea europaea subsp. europaea]|uniref:Disease resistance RGA3 n=1 Tax=Olea europaea subsp. europaea TaxID=158383 RepID=A0A8S0T9K1_OLEEU|nr:disease resistance RGA3 [Olea europaea subsp. europaea]
MAQGYLCPVKNVEMEVLGEEYLQNLAMGSFFQDIEKDKDCKRILKFKMHGMVHDFAQYLTKRECSVVEVDGEFAVNLGSSYKTTRHLTLFGINVCYWSFRAQQFWVQSFFDTPPIISELDKIEPDLCNRLACLKALDLSRNRLRELPKLQTLNLSACDNLRKLPQEMGKLVNLSDMWTRGFEIMKNLRGCLKIEGLSCVTNANEARIAELSEKKHISDLHLDFNSKAQLHPGLQSLVVSSYEGTRFPNWMVSLTNLKDLSLQECQNCTILSPLARLPSLVTLHIDDNVNDQITADSKDRSLALSSEEYIAFPKLKKLKISDMGSWEEWNMIRTADIKVMPKLHFLKLYNCSNLKALPDPLFKMTPIRKLGIQNCPIMQQKYKKETEDQYWIIFPISRSSKYRRSLVQII